MYRVCEGKIYFPGHFLWFFGGYKDVYVVDLLRRLKEILGEFRQASYKPKPSSMGRKEDTT